jgi:oligo-1,6-glucosidase
MEDYMEKTWWKEGVVYQIYPRSFMDSNGDGIGDLKGIVSKVPYLKELGVDIVWLCPVYASPNNDNGYDISDYRNIMEEFGTLEDLEELLKRLHEFGIKLIMDLVINHTSDEHPWFIESRSSKDNKYRDYYIWKKSRNSLPPSNWGSCFGGNSWEYDDKTDEYYLHLYTKQQPDLNFNNQEVRNEIQAMVKWWLDKGIDGFRLDSINTVSKDINILNELPEPENSQWAGLYFMNKPSIHDLLREINDNVLSKYDVMTVGETPNVTPEEGIMYCAPERRELNMIFQFELMDIDGGPEGKWQIVPWSLDKFKAIITKWQQGLYEKGWNSLYLNNHDQPRMVSRFGDDTCYRNESAKLLATLLHTLQGTPYIYQGEELGMTNVAFDSIDRYRDIETLNAYDIGINEKHYSQKDIMYSIHKKSRDNARTPMQWDESANAGFTKGTPWIGVNPSYKDINAKKEMLNSDSIFNYYKKLLELRKKYPIIVYGKYTLLDKYKSPLFVYTRELSGQILQVILNFTGETTNLAEDEVNSLYAEGYQLILANYNQSKLKQASLMPYEARVYIKF